VSHSKRVGWRQDNGNGSNQESRIDFLATRQCLVKIDEGQQKIKIDEGQQKKKNRPHQMTNNPVNLIVVYGVPANQFSPSAGTTLARESK